MSFYNFGSQPSYGSVYAPRIAPSSSLSPLGDDLFRNDKSAVFADFLRGINTQGRGAFGNSFKQFADDWVQRLYPEYNADTGLGNISGDLSFRDYVNERSPEMAAQFKYATQARRPLARATRFIRRF